MAAVVEGEGSAQDTQCGVFCSHQQTELATKTVKGFVGANMGRVKASAPGFNVRGQGQWSATLEEYNVPCFGPTIKNATMQLFDSAEIKGLSTRLEVDIPQPTLDAFVQGKMSKVRALLDEAERRPDRGTGRNPEAIGKLRAFVDAFEKLPKERIQSTKDWEDFVGQYIVKERQADWQSRLHFDYVLLNFGFEQETATALQKTDYQDGHKTVRLEEYSLRWLSKALSAFGVAGAMSDVVNLVFAMQKKTNDEIEALKRGDGSTSSDSKIAAVIDEFGKRLKRKDVKGMWVPEYMVFDGEVDDTLAWLLLTYVHQCCGKPAPKVLAQLPAKDIDTDKLERVEEQLRKHGVQVFRDPESTNVKNLLSNFKKILK